MDLLGAKMRKNRIARVEYPSADPRERDRASLATVALQGAHGPVEQVSKLLLREKEWQVKWRRWPFATNRDCRKRHRGT